MGIGYMNFQIIFPRVTRDQTELKQSRLAKIYTFCPDLLMGRTFSHLSVEDQQLQQIKTNPVLYTSLLHCPQKAMHNI